MMAALARRRGARVVWPVVHGGVVRDLEQIALENAVEGCVRETFAALVARRQAIAAADLDVRAAMRRIAADEARHAALAFRVDAWARARLSPAARARVADARARARAELVHELAHVLPASLVDGAGLPPPDEAVALSEALFASLEGGRRSRAVRSSCGGRRRAR